MSVTKRMGRCVGRRVDGVNFGRNRAAPRVMEFIKQSEREKERERETDRQRERERERERRTDLL